MHNNSQMKTDDILYIHIDIKRNTPDYRINVYDITTHTHCNVKSYD